MMQECKQYLRFWTADTCQQGNFDDVDLIVTLGGDGTVLYTSWLFQREVPPVLPFFLGIFFFPLFFLILFFVFLHL